VRIGHTIEDKVQYSVMQNDDWDNIRACLDGDKEAYALLVRKYEADISKLMWRFSRNPGVCERLVQDVFVDAYVGLKSYRGSAPFLHWLKRIGTRVGYRFWKEQGNQNRHLPLTDFDAIETVDEDTIAASEAAEILHALLARLPRADRLVLTLIYFEDSSIKEISKQMKWTQGMVKMRAMRARRKIKAIAEQENLLEKLGWIH